MTLFNEPIDNDNVLGLPDDPNFPAVDGSLDPILETNARSPQAGGLEPTSEPAISSDPLFQPADGIALETSNTAISNSPDNFFGNPLFVDASVVGDTGEVTFDYLSDNGKYRFELAAISLEGMDAFWSPDNLTAFNAEAARRASTNSTQGRILISDAVEGAKFDGVFNEGDRNWNAGEYLGPKTVQMQPGDRVAFMLVPNGTVQQVLENPDIGGSKSPLFSIPAANPDGDVHFARMSNLPGDGITLAIEDSQIDADYNDALIQVRGITSRETALDVVIDPALDWRDSDLGKAIASYTQPYITPELPLDGGSSIDPPEPVVFDFPAENQPLIGFIDTGVAANNPDLNYDKITLGGDRVDGDDNPLLEPGEGSQHGTHTLGIVAAQRDNGIGIDGINPDAPIWVGRAIDSGQWADSLTEFVDTSIAENRTNSVVYLGFDLTEIDAQGTENTRYELTPQERTALELTRQNNILIVVPAGNQNGVMSVLGQASQEFDNIATVGAAENFDPTTSPWQGFDRVGYSSYGRGLNLLAPGGSGLISTVGDGIGIMAGTSVAAAQVTGFASLMRAANPDLTPRQVIDLLESTTTDLTEVGWDAETGAGLLNPEAAIRLAQLTPAEEYDPAPFSIPTTWSGEGLVTPWERAAATVDADPSGRRFYFGELDDENPVDELEFNLDTNAPLSLAVNFGDASLGTATLSGSNGFFVDIPTRDGELFFNNDNQNLEQGNYTLTINRGINPEVDPYLAVLNFNIGADGGDAVDDFEFVSLAQDEPAIPANYAVFGDFQTKYENNATELGDAIAPEIDLGRATSQEFQFGYIVGFDNAGEYQTEVHFVAEPPPPIPVLDPILETYLENDGETGWLGQAIEEAVETGNGVISQLFENGEILWNQILGTAYEIGSDLISILTPNPEPTEIPDLGPFLGRHEYTGNVSAEDDKDIYRFNVGDRSLLQFSLSQLSDDATMTLYSVENLAPPSLILEADATGNGFDKFGSITLEPGNYLVQIDKGLASADTDYNMVLNLAQTLNDADETSPFFGTYTGRQDEIEGFLDNDGLAVAQSTLPQDNDRYRIDIDSRGNTPATLRFRVEGIEDDAEVQVRLMRNGSGAADDVIIEGTNEELITAEGLEPGRYSIGVDLLNDVDTPYTLVTQLDHAGESEIEARDLGDLTGQRQVYRDFVGSERDPSDYYQFEIQDSRLLQFRTEGDVDVELLNVETETDENGVMNAELAPGDYFVKVEPGEEDSNYELILNLSETVVIGPSDPFTQDEYTERLYGHGGNTFTRGLQPGHNGLDTTDGVAPFEVRAVVGGIVQTGTKNGLVVANPVVYNPATQLYECQNSSALNNGTVIIRNDDLDRTFIYYHFEENSVTLQAGDIVNPGDIIGIEGNTGCSTGRHTHLEVTHNGAIEDPLVTLGIARSSGILDKNYSIPENDSLFGKQIVLDPGHGETNEGYKPGAPGNGTDEATENLIQANVVADYLLQRGAEVTIVDEPISLLEIGQRSVGADAFISLHLNAFNGMVQGHEVLVHPNYSTEDIQLATAINNELDNTFDDSEIPPREIKDDLDLEVLREVLVPAVLTEALFIDAPGMSRANVEKGAQAIARGIENFLVNT